MPDGDVDSFDLPLHEQSGLLDRTTIDQANAAELGEQAAALNDALNNYYSGETNFNEVFDDLINLGYSEDRARSIRQASQMERTIRFQTGGSDIASHNPGTPSNLAPNQLIAIARAGAPVTGRFHVYTGDDGRQFFYDTRTREVDGTPSRIFLPAPVQFNPLTEAQQAEQEQREQELAPTFLSRVEPFVIRPNPNVDLEEDFSYSDRTTLDQISQDYLSNPTPEGLQSLRENIDLFLTDSAANVEGGGDKLNQFLFDIQYEAEFRLENDGRPQLLSVQEYEFLKTHPDYNFDNNALVYEVEGTDTRYYYDSYRGRARAVPTLDSRGDVVSQDLTADNLINLLPNSITIRGIRYTPPNPSLSVRTEGGVLTREEQESLRSDMALAINGDISYPDFLERLNSEYDLNSEQFISVSQVVLNNNAGPQISQQDASLTGYYTDVPVYVYSERGRTSLTSDQSVFLNTFSQTDPGIIQEQINRIDNTWRITNYAVRQAAATGRAAAGTNPVSAQQYVATELSQGRLDPDLIAPPDIQLERPTPAPVPPRLEPYQNPDDPSFDVEELLEELNDGDIPVESVPEDVREIFEEQGGLLNPPVVPGQTQPVDPSGNNIPVLTPQEQVIRYENYFNSQQREFIPFRNMFRDFLPVFGGAAGGYFAFSLARSRERGTIQEILREERVLLDALDVRVGNIQEAAQRQRDEIQFLRQQEDIEIMEGAPQLAPGPSGPGTSPTDPVIDPLEQLARLESEPASEADLEFIREQIQEAEGNLDSLEMDIINEDVSRAEVNSRIDNLIQTDRKILTDIYRYNPQILTGIQIGATLGLVLSGYFFPTYVDIEDNQDFIKADNINYNPKDPKKEQQKHPLPDKPDIPFNIMKPEKIDLESRDKNKLVQPVNRNFIPVKAGSRGSHLSYKQIQEYKATLSSKELENLRGQSLIFGVDGYVLKKADKCMSVVKETIITQKKIKI